MGKYVFEFGGSKDKLTAYAGSPREVKTKAPSCRDFA